MNPWYIIGWIIVGSIGLVIFGWLLYLYGKLLEYLKNAWEQDGGWIMRLMVGFMFFNALSPIAIGVWFLLEWVDELSNV